MKVFLSWSGVDTKSHAVARALDEWLPTVLNAVDPWISSRGLMAGLQWNQQLDRELDNTNFGIIVVTPWNQHSQWLNFEAGALSKRVGGLESRVAPLLVDFPNVAKLTGPLSSYQVVLPTKDGINQLVLSINQALGEESRKFDALERAFDVCWPALESMLKKIDEDLPSEADPAAAPTPRPAAADETDMFSEILNAIRGLARSDARLRNEIHKSTAGQQEPTVVYVPAATAAGAPHESLGSRTARAVERLGYATVAVRRGPSGRVRVILSQPISKEQEQELAEGLDWDDLKIRSLHVEPLLEEED
ncbi:toll/interleukin-1 receptor domain-containing protein [Pseudarthrobacter sp. NS4]|uniref:toll/interleukin-1 receptor domain-containing protein n=1 Tax=Pseudarthrobacter sp. NS4 TaxID=2973976 RepID=UPI002162BE1D|nr:toll/interleukin-1 receptor domain-containing protein [Pseudarthrobacter sp. NS4]